MAILKHIKYFPELHLE